MFFVGDLASGITTAIQQQKSVVCFVTDDKEESKTWESDFLLDDQLKHALSTAAVTLRLQAGGPEAAYLAEIYPLPKTPTLVVILNGQRKEYITSGINRTDFVTRVLAALTSASADTGTARNTAPSPSAIRSSPPAQASSQETPPPAATTASIPVAPTAPVSESTPSAPRSIPTTVQESTTQTPEIRSLLSDRRARLEAEKAARDAAQKAERAAAAAAIAARTAASSDGSSSATVDPKKSADLNYAAQQKRRRQEAREERARILRRVEDDKIARREREARRKEQVRAEASTGGEIDAGPSSTLPASNLNASKASSSAQSSSTTRSSATCAVQVRLFDGSTIRSRFPSNQTLRHHVREWVDSQKDTGATPYTFKVVLTPLPNRTIGDSEEEESLSDLGLCPSATLILVPVQGFSEAYEGGPAGLIGATVGAVRSGVTAGYGLVAAGAGYLGGFFGAPTVPAQGLPAGEDGAVPHGQLRSRREGAAAEEPQQFYNGNSLSFEPRREDDDNKRD